jgi:lipoyl(octanoyl) transferase
MPAPLYSSDAVDLEVRDLGLVPYGDALEVQADLVVRRRAGEVPDQLLLLEHPHVITLGTGSHPAHVLVDVDRRETLGLDLFEAGRGGDVTYHGPGQLVGYPILDLKPDRRDLLLYLRDLESVLIASLEKYGVQGKTIDGLTGVWVEDRKIAAIGVRVSSGWITSHGFALNVDTDLSYYDTIVPCGIVGRSVTSLSRELGHRVEVAEVSAVVREAFAAGFEREIRVGGPTIGPSETPG